MGNSASSGQVTVFDDEFTSTTLDRGRWSILYGGGQLYANGAFRWDAGQVSVSDGLLHIGMTRAADGIWDVGGLSSAGYPGAAAGIGFGFTYGHVEIRAKVSSTVAGAGPCFLLWPSGNDHWPPEVNILETPQGQGMFTNHWPGPGGANWYESHLFPLDDSQWHSYGLDWAADHLTMSVDGTAMYSITAHIPTERLSLGLQGYVGAATDYWYGGSPNASGLDHVQIEVDYVRVTQPATGPVTVLEAAGATRLVQVGSGYALWDTAGAGPLLRYQGAVVAAGQFGGAWAPVGAEASGGGYLVAWRNGADFCVWSVDAAGNHTGTPTGLVKAGDPGLEQLEAAFQQDLNGDGSIGPPVTVLEAAGATRLVQVGSGYALWDTAGAGPLLRYQGAVVAAGQFGGAWAPVGAEASGGGYLVAWKNGADFCVWSVDAAGNHTGTPTGLVKAGDPGLEQLETAFQQDLNGDGSIGPPVTVLEAAGVTRLVQVGSGYALWDTAGAGPLLRYQGAVVAAGQFGGAWAPVGAEASGGGYLVAWKNGADFCVWSVDAAGNHTGTPTGLVKAGDPGLEQLETAFQQDLNGDGHLGWLL